MHAKLDQKKVFRVIFLLFFSRSFQCEFILGRTLIRASCNVELSKKKKSLSETCYRSLVLYFIPSLWRANSNSRKSKIRLLFWLSFPVFPYTICFFKKKKNEPGGFQAELSASFFLFFPHSLTMIVIKPQVYAFHRALYYTQFFAQSIRKSVFFFPFFSDQKLAIVKCLLFEGIEPALFE